MKRKQAFTLVEMLMVICLVSVLALIAVPQFIDFGSDAKKAVTQDRLNQLRTAIVGDPKLIVAGKYIQAGFLNHCQGPPNDLTELATMPPSGLCSSDYNPLNQLGWKGPYISTSDANWMKDAWGSMIQYDVVSRTLRSCGSDQNCFTDDDLVVSF